MVSLTRKDPAWLKAYAEKFVVCAVCQARPREQLHHLKGLDYWCGVSLKAPDYLIIPVCDSDHARVHRCPELQIAPFVRTYHQAVKYGVVDIDVGRVFDHAHLDLSQEILSRELTECEKAAFFDCVVRKTYSPSKDWNFTSLTACWAAAAELQYLLPRRP